MERGILIYSTFLLTIFFILPPLVQAPDLCSYRGYANKSGTLVNTSDTITVTGANALYNATVFSDGSYTLDAEAQLNANITFQIDGVNVAQGYRTFTCGADTLVTLNLSITLLSDGATCSYSLACSGRYCCSGATQISGGAGSGTCQSSACSAPSGGGGSTGGGGGAAATTTTIATTTTLSTTTTTLPPPITETTIVTQITPQQPAIIETKNPDDVKIEKIEIEVTNPVNNVEVTITRTFSQPTDVAISASSATDEKVYTYLKIEKTNIDDSDVKNVKIRFKVEKSWLTNNNIDASTVALKRYENGVWGTLTTNKVSEDGTYVYYEAISAKLSVFAIIAKQLPAPTTTASTISAVTTTTVPVEILPKLKNIVPFFLALVIIVVFILFFYYAYRKK